MVLSFDRWVGKVAVVTGASSGIGAAIAEQLVEKGALVAGLARRRDRLEQLANKVVGKKGKLYPVEADISKEEDILKAFAWIKENLGIVHILVNNAGVAHNGSLIDDKTEDWERVFRINVLGLSIATREAIKDMKANNVDGHIIHINSIVGHQAAPNISVYPASKFAVRALAETLRLELNSMKSKIKITNISPGLIDTEAIPPQMKTEEFYKEGKIIGPDAIADGVVYALSTPPHVQVVGLARRKDRFEKLANKFAGKAGKFYPVVTDISKEEDVLKAFAWVKENLGPIHILVNNAGMARKGNIHDGDTEEWKRVFKVNVLGLCIATREAIKDMKANNIDGHIIHINSIVGHQAYSGTSVYPASKFAVTALAETLRLELNSLKSKIKITSISPGLVDTEILPQDFDLGTFYKEGKIIRPEDIADGVVYALSTPPHVQIQELTIRPIIDFF
ncbi:hypothetical protein NQ318_019513 [Aromia moschata]|uniref:Uncharacterized protein n=1 Tax=Aromia moschata TaxID=1265417 RepID=A0AAV8XY93_9CUCU|nr:hypothetical protein NQ318_019513 [Aromia moschata]